MQFQVLFHSPSGVLFTFPSRYLCTIGRVRVFSLGRWSSQIPTELPGSSVVLRNLAQALTEFRLRGFHPLWLTFPGHSANLEIFRPGGKVGLPVVDPATPDIQRAHAFTDIRFGLFPFRSPLLRESLLLSFPRGTEMVHFPRFAFRHYVFMAECPPQGRTGYPIRESRDHRLLAPPPGLSQLATPFIARTRRGIHCMPLVAWP